MISCVTGFILNLENLESRPFCTKIQGKTRIVMEFCMIVIQVRKKSRETDYLVHILFSSSLCIVTHKVVVLFVVSKCELYHFA